MYTTLDCQAATPLQAPAAVVVGEAAPLVAVVGPGCVDDPAQALTVILSCERIQGKRWTDGLALHPFEPLLGTALVQ